MLKDNHVWSAGNITEAVRKARSAAGFSMKIEVSVCSMLPFLIIINNTGYTGYVYIVCMHISMYVYANWLSLSLRVCMYVCY